MSVDLTKPDPATPDPNVPQTRRADARLRRRSRSAVARSAAGDRWLVTLIGLVLLTAGVGVTLLSYGVFGTARAGRPLLDPIIVDTVAADPVLWRAIAIAGGIVLAVLGLAWVARRTGTGDGTESASNAGNRSKKANRLIVVTWAVRGAARLAPPLQGGG
jgi:hypothetical protein